MSDKTPKDEYDGISRPEEPFGFPGGGEEGPAEEERAVSFDEEYPAGHGVEPRERSFYDQDEEEQYPPEESGTGGLAAIWERLRSIGEKRAEKPRKKKARPSKNPPPYGERAPVTAGMDLRNDEMLVYDSELDEIDYTDGEDMPEMRDYMPIRFRRYGRIGVGGGILYALFIISASIVLACFAWMCASDVLGLNKEDRSAIVTVDKYEPTGDDPIVNEDGDRITADIDQVASALKNAGVIEYRWLFKIFSGISHAEVKIDPGTYDVSSNLDYRAIVNTLQFGSGKQEVTQVTFPEGFTLEQIFTLLEENQICEKADLYEAAANYEFDYDFLEGLELGDPNRLEGYLFPDTYEFYQGEDASVAINRFLSNFNNKITDDMRSRASDWGLSLHELITFASLVEKEAANDDERGTIASVIWNRLDAGWKLQLDSTINYIKGTNTFDLTFDDLEIESPYNTYLYEGLPVGPICSPGLASVQAVIDHESTDYWYWYAVDSKSYFFTNDDDRKAFIDSLN